MSFPKPIFHAPLNGSVDAIRSRGKDRAQIPTVTGVPLFEDCWGGAGLYFSTNGKLTFPLPESFSPPRGTIEFRLRAPISSHDIFGPVFSTEVSGISDRFSFGYYGPNLYISLQIGGGAPEITNSTTRTSFPLLTGCDNHLVTVWNDADPRFEVYINGKKYGSDANWQFYTAPTDYSVFDSGTQFAIGDVLTSTDPGIITDQPVSDFRIYDVDLTDEQVLVALKRRAPVGASFS